MAIRQVNQYTRKYNFISTIKWLCLLIVGLTSCNVTKYLNEDQKLLKKNIIEIQSDDLSNREKKQINEKLTLLLRQFPNRKLALTTYFKNQGRTDTSYLQNLMVKFLSEEPSYFDSLIIKSTASSMENYLKKSGYFDAVVRYVTTVKGKYGTVKYFVIPKKVYRFRDIIFEVVDPELSLFLKNYWEDSYLKRGEIVSDEIYTKEKTRISKILHDNGYYYFDPSVIGPLIGDSSRNQVDVAFRINKSVDPKITQRFTINRINIHSDYNPNYKMLYNLDTLIEGYRFLQVQKKFKIKPSTILKYTYIKPNKLYSQNDFDRTFNQLNRLGLYKFVNISEKRDELDTSKLNIDIRLPQDKTMPVNYNFDMSLSNLRTLVTSGNNFSLSMQGGITVVKKNLFNGGEILRSNAGIGLEIPFSKYTNSRQNYKLDNELIVPRFMDYLFLVRGLSNLKFGQQQLFSERFLNSLNDKTTTNIQLAYEYVFFKDWYKYININASYGFEIRTDDERQIKFNTVGFTYFKPEAFDKYTEILTRNPFLERSFTGQRLFTGALLRDFIYSYQSRVNRLGQAVGMNINGELSGFEVNLLNDVFDPNNRWTLLNSDFSRFWKLSLELRGITSFTRNLVGASQFKIGYARPFGITEAVPYVKQYEIGGPFSIRGWAIRELGPGGYKDPDAANYKNFYQTGDFKLEWLSELRFNIFSIIKGAVFLDAGNVWANKSKLDLRPGANFQFDQLYQTLAIGSGLGIRLDVTFFVMRVDLGFKVKYPYQLENQGYYNTFSGMWREKQWNFALGYPFF